MRHHSGSNRGHDRSYVFPGNMDLPEVFPDKLLMDFLILVGIDVKRLFPCSPAAGKKAIDILQGGVGTFHDWRIPK